MYSAIVLWLGVEQQPLSFEARNKTPATTTARSLYKYTTATTAATTTAIMSSSSVWVQLYYKGKKEAEGDPVQVYQSELAAGREWNIASLKEAAKAKSKLDLDVPLNRIFVHNAGTTPPFSEDKALKAWDPIPSNSSGPQPLIVVAPDPKQAHGEKF